MWKWHWKVRVALPFIFYFLVILLLPNVHSLWGWPFCSSRSLRYERSLAYSSFMSTNLWYCHNFYLLHLSSVYNTFLFGVIQYNFVGKSQYNSWWHFYVGFSRNIFVYGWYLVVNFPHIACVDARPWFMYAPIICYSFLHWTRRSKKGNNKHI